MKICEEFSTLQGEGKYLGVPSYFIRTTGCNLRCAWKNKDNSITLCDTPYTSFKPEVGTDLDVDNVLKKLSHTNIKHIVITGGEPLIQHDIADVCRQFVDKQYKVTVETNGTIYKPLLDVFVSISPKLASSYNQPEQAERDLHTKNNKFYDAVRKYVENNDYQLKFVYNYIQDIVEVDKFADKLKIPANKIYLMPQGITKEQFQEKQEELFKVCMRFGYTYTPRMHVDIFGNKRGI